MLIVYNSSVMDFSKRLTDNARDVLAHAEVLARVSGSPYIGTEHLLLGILSQENSVGAHILRNAGVQFDRVKSALSLVTTANSNGTLTPTKGFSETAKLTLRMSIELASEFHQDYCGTEHILFSLLNQTNARAATVLSDLNIDTKSIISDLEEKMGKLVRVDGEVLQVQQTSGPTIFTITDESNITWVAAFDEAGVRAYPDIDVGDAVEVLGEVNQHGGKPQIESQSISKLEGEKKAKLQDLIEDALNKRAEPDDVDFLVKSDVLNRLKPKMREAAQKIRRAILDGRSILLRHHNDADGICSGVAMEKAIVPLVEQVNPSNDAQYYYFKRSPSKAPFYELEDVVKDLSFALEDKERHGQKLPLIVLLDNGSTEEDIVALMQAKV